MTERAADAVEEALAEAMFCVVRNIRISYTHPLDNGCWKHANEGPFFRYMLESPPQILTDNEPTRHQTGEILAGSQEGEGAGSFFAVVFSSCFFIFFGGPGPKSSRRKEGMTLTASDKEQDTRAQFQEPKDEVKLEKKKQDTEPSIHLPLTRCKFRQETQRGEAAKRRAAKNAQATSALVFCRGPNFLNHTRMTASPPPIFLHRTQSDSALGKSSQKERDKKTYQTCICKLM